MFEIGNSILYAIKLKCFVKKFKNKFTLVPDPNRSIIPNFVIKGTVHKTQYFFKIPNKTSWGPQTKV